MTFTLLAVLIIGLVIFAISDNAKASEIGRLMFACALLAVCLGGGAAHLVKLLP